jgi:hypothetical protein
VSSDDTSYGKCHLCKRILPIVYCGRCRHYFCEDCRHRWFDRGLEFVKQLVGGRRKGCCGIIEW